MEIGMIELRRIKMRVNWMARYYQPGDWRTTTTRVSRKRTLKRIFERRLIYQSRMPTLLRGLIVPREMRVYLPVKMTRPSTVPFASTVLVQRVFYRVSLSFLPPPENSLNS
jgi:hypothetical protein